MIPRIVILGKIVKSMNVFSEFQDYCISLQCSKLGLLPRNESHTGWCLVPAGHHPFFLLFFHFSEIRRNRLGESGVYLSVLGVL